MHWYVQHVNSALFGQALQQPMHMCVRVLPDKAVVKHGKGNEHRVHDGQDDEEMVESVAHLLGGEHGDGERVAQEAKEPDGDDCDAFNPEGAGGDEGAVEGRPGTAGGVVEVRRKGGIDVRHLEKKCIIFLNGIFVLSDIGLWPDSPKLTAVLTAVAKVNSRS
jgi:hypothetical protein